MQRIKLITVIFASFAGFLMAADMDWQAQFRARMERPDKLPDDQISAATITHLRSRLMFRMQQDYLSAVMQFQDVRFLGADQSNSGLTKPDSTNFGLHQVYLSIDQLFSPGWKLTIGRFEMNLGNQRLFSHNNWNNYGRSFDGFRLQTSGKRYGAGEIFYLKVYEAFLDNLSDNHDTDINGIYLRPVTLNLSGLGLNRLEIYGYQEINRGNTARRIKRTTYGSRLTLSLLIFGFEVEGARQIGTDVNDNDINSWFSVANLEIKTRFLPIIKKITIGKEFYTGDDTSTISREGFANPYGAGHKFHGYFDAHKYFRDNQQTGLSEWNVKLNLTFKPHISTLIHYHSFSEGWENGRRLGNELNLEYIQKIGQYGRFTMGYAIYNYGPASGESGTGEIAYTVLSITL